MPVDRRTFDAPDGPPAAGVYSHGVVSGGFLYCAGQVPSEPTSGVLVKGDIGVQTARCLDNLAIVCRAEGARLEDAVRVGVFLTDLPRDFAAMNEAYTEWFGGDFPARTTIGVTALAEGADIEIDAVVRLPE